MESVKSVRVSVIVPVYDAEAYLPRCVESIRRQNCRELEIVLVDDGSRDAGGRMCDGYAGEDDRIRVVHKENGGLMSAWMEGVRVSTGDYLCFIDSDDWVEPQMIEELLRHASGGEREIICCNFLISRPDKEIPCRHGIEPGVYEGKELFHRIKENLLGNENRTVSLSRCMKLFTRELIEENLKLCDPAIRMGEDVNIVLPALLDSRRVVILKDAFYYHYYYNPQSMVHKYDPSMYDNIRRLDSAIQRVFRAKTSAAGPAGQPVPLTNAQAQARKEYSFLLMLALKNELRNRSRRDPAVHSADGVGRVQEICGKEDTPALLSRYPVRAASMAGRLLLFVMRHPRRIYIRLAACILQLHDGVTNAVSKLSD